VVNGICSAINNNEVNSNGEIAAALLLPKMFSTRDGIHSCSKKASRSRARPAGEP
jgi:hypothetical protein